MTMPVPRPTRSRLSTSLTVLAALFGLAVGSPDAQASDHPATDALGELAGKKAKPELIQNKFFVKTNRFEIAPVLGYVPNNSFVTNVYGGAITAYHFSDSFAAEGTFLYAPNTGVAGVKGLTNTLVALASSSSAEGNFKQPLDRLQLGAIFSARWAPVYGKINLIGEGVANFDLYGTGGVGLLMVTKDYATLNPECPGGVCPEGAIQSNVEEQPATESHPAFNVGFGMDFFITQSLALKLDARSALYVAEEPDYGNGDALDKQLYSTFLASAGVSIFVPRMKPRMFNF